MTATLRTEALTTAEVSTIRDLLWTAFADDEGFEEDVWAHALGGTHFVARLEGAIVAHASVVGRILHVDGSPLRTRYVEAVATARAHQGRGVGSHMMSAAGAHIVEAFELGALGTGRIAFYERLGWRVWATSGSGSVTPRNGWTVGCVLGLLAVFLTSFAAWLFPIALLVGIAVGFVGARLSALSGYLIGFGLIWLALMGWQFASGGHLDNAPGWAAVGVGAVMAGAALGLVQSERS